MTVLSMVAALLRPSGEELERVVARETDPRYADEFEQLCPGPILAAAGLAAIAICGALGAPYRVVSRLLRSR